ncbi:MAG: flagellar filament capping protein FliD [Geminicoccaceae bacterium]
MADALSLGSLSTSGTTTRLTGTSSGIDTGKLVDALVEAKRIPAVRLEKKIDANTAKQAAYKDLRTKLDALQKAVAGLRNPPGLLGTDGNLFEKKDVYFSSDTTTSPATLLGVSAGNKVAPGSFQVTVDRLATARKFMSDGAASATAALADTFNGGTAFSGSFELGLDGGTTAAIDVDGTMSLQDLKAVVNAKTAQTGISANVLKVADNDWRLVLSAGQTGREVVLNPAGGDDVRGLLGLWNSSTSSFKNPVAAAQTAQVTIDGVTMTRPDNHITDAIDGVTLDLFKAEPGTKVTVDVQRSLAGVKEQIGSFVDAYNAVQDAFDQYASLNESGQRPDGAVLYGDTFLRGLDQALGGIVGGAVGGLGQGAVATLAGLGIKLDQDNRLQIDEAKLDDRLTADLDAVRNVFEFRFTSSSDKLRVFARDNRLADNAFTISVVDADNDGVPESATADGVALQIEGNRLKGADGTAYAGLQMIWVGKGSESIDVTATQGVADRIFNNLDRVLGDGDGSLTKVADALDRQSADFQKEIGRIDERADRLREQLVAKFTALEAAMATAKALLDQVKAQMGVTQQN